jgi:hypothetical protein
MASGFLFFAYGEHMDAALMEQLHPDVDQLGLARADGQRFGFNAKGCANLKPESGSMAWGVLWFVPAKAQTTLDQWATERGLFRDIMMVVSPAGPRIPATAYFDRSAVGGVPASAGLDLILRAARAQRLDLSYQHELTGWLAKT